MNNGWLKVRSVAMGGAILGLIGFATVAKISATPGQFLVIDGGAKTKKLIGPLEEVATELDSAPDAYRAHWSPDSKHVGISSREDRHLLRNVIYRIENQRAYLVETPELLCYAVPDFCQLQKDLGGGLKLNDDNYYEAPWKVRQNEDASEIVKWISPTRFIVSEESQWQVRERDPSAAIGQYGEVEKPESDEPAVYHVWFNAEGQCELFPGDKSRVINTHLVKKSEKEE